MMVIFPGFAARPVQCRVWWRRPELLLPLAESLVMLALSSFHYPPSPHTSKKVHGLLLATQGFSAMHKRYVNVSLEDPYMEKW